MKFSKDMNFHKKQVWLDISMKTTKGEKINIPVFCSDSRLINYIIETIERLPEEDVKHLVLEKKLVIIQPYYATAFSLESSVKPIWILSLYDNLCDAEKWYIIYTIVHELAHIYLGHGITKLTDIKYLEKNNLVELPEQEIEDDKQVVKWGFEKELKQFQTLITHKAKKVA